MMAESAMQPNTYPPVTAIAPLRRSRYKNAGRGKPTGGTKGR
jgi:hypothetical protein